MVDMRVIGKPSNFDGDEASWKSWSGSLARTACSDGKGQDDGRRHEEREPHSGRAGVEQTVALHAQPEHERGGAEETAERARGRWDRCVEGVLGTPRAEDHHEVRRHAQADSLV